MNEPKIVWIILRVARAYAIAFICNGFDGETTRKRQPVQYFEATERERKKEEETLKKIYMKKNKQHIIYIFIITVIHFSYLLANAVALFLGWICKNSRIIPILVCTSCLSKTHGLLMICSHYKLTHFSVSLDHFFLFGSFERTLMLWLSNKLHFVQCNDGILATMS